MSSRNISGDYVALCPLILHVWRTNVSPVEIGVALTDVESAAQQVLWLAGTGTIAAMTLRDARGITVFRWRDVDSTDEFLEALARAAASYGEAAEIIEKFDLRVRELRVLRTHSEGAS